MGLRLAIVVVLGLAGCDAPAPATESLRAPGSARPDPVTRPLVSVPMACSVEPALLEARGLAAQGRIDRASRVLEGAALACAQFAHDVWPEQAPVLANGLVVGG